MRQAFSKGVIGSSESWKVSVQSGLLRKMMLENFGEVGKDGIVVPCVAFFVESCRTAVENMVNCTMSSFAKGAARVRLDFPGAEIDWCWKALNSSSNHERHLSNWERKHDLASHTSFILSTDNVQELWFNR